MVRERARDARAGRVKKIWLWMRGKAEPVLRAEYFQEQVVARIPARREAKIKTGFRQPPERAGGPSPKTASARNDTCA